MPQYYPAPNINILDALSNLGAIKTAIFVDTPGVIRSTPSTLCQIAVLSPGSAGTLTVTDATSLTGGTALYSANYNQLSAGQMIPFAHDCSNGIAITTIPTGGIFQVCWFFTQTSGPFTNS